MKKLFLLLVVFSLFLTGTVYADFTSGSTGADGAFNPTANTQLQLPPNGVFNYTTVNIPVGVTVTFAKNAANTPVYILATGNVTIAGTINVNGVGAWTTGPGAGGPGGFDGGRMGNNCASGSGGANGLGPGGGGGAPSNSHPFSGGGGYGTSGGSYDSSNGAGGAVYGNAEIQPLIGGSGGGGGCTYSSHGGGGGGAILIASSGTITITGSITASGGPVSSGGAGSGGAIRLVSNNFTGTGTLSVAGGTANGGLSGGQGRVRIEANSNSFTGSPTLYAVPQPQPVFFSSVPSLNIVSIAGVSVPANPTASYLSPDIWLPSSAVNPVTVAIAATNIPAGTSVTVSVVPEFGSASSATSTLSGTTQSSTATANVTLPTSGYASVITVQASFPIQTAMLWEGERIEKVKVIAKMGRYSEVFYITESGKEIRANLIARL